MTYRVRFEQNLGGDQPEAGWREPNKDEAISRLVWILASMEWGIEVVFPDGSTLGSDWEFSTDFATYEED